MTRLTAWLNRRPTDLDARAARTQPAMRPAARPAPLAPWDEPATFTPCTTPNCRAACCR